MKKRILNILLVLCLMVGILSTGVLADSSQTGTVVWFDLAGAASGQTIGYAYANSHFFMIGPGFSTSFHAPVLQVGQSVRFDIVNGINLSVKDGSLSATDSDAMSISISGDSYVGKNLTIDVSTIPFVGTVSVQLYHASIADKVFDAGNELGKAVSYSAGMPITHTVTSASIGKFIGAKATYTVDINGKEYVTTLTARTAQQMLVGGSCGDDLTWNITGTEGHYTLAISGTGAMTDYDNSDNMAPWLSPELKDADNEPFYSYIDSLVLSQGITHIGNYAFSIGNSCISIQNSTFPSTLLSIGEGAFRGCYSNGLDLSLTLPNGLTTLGLSAFGNCLGITEVLLPASLTMVGEGVFSREISTSPLAVYCLASSADAVPNWANSWYLTNTGELATVRFPTYHAAVAPTCVNAGTEEYYAFDGDGVSEEMAGRCYNTQKTSYTDTPGVIAATGIHIMDETGKCSVCQQTYDVAASVKIGGSAAMGYNTMTEALKAANVVTGSETVTVTALKSCVDGGSSTVTLTRTSPIVLELGGHTVTLDGKSFTVNCASVTVQNGTLAGGTGNLVLIDGEASFTLAANATLAAGSGVTALKVNNGSAALHGTVTVPDVTFAVVSTGGGHVTVDGGNVQSLLAAAPQNATLSGGAFGKINCNNTTNFRDLLKPGYAFKYSGDDGTWVTAYPTSSSESLTNVSVTTAPVLITAHPQNASVVYGSTATLCVTATGATSYNWHMSGDSTDSYAGNNDGTLAIPSNLNVGTYYFRANCIGEAGWSVNSDAATVIVTKAPGVITNESYPLRYVYSGEAVEEPRTSQITTNGNTLTFKWFDAQGTTELSSAPSDAGTYTLRATSTETLNYEGTIKDFIVTIVLPVELSAQLSGANIVVSVKNNTNVSCEYTLYCATYDTNGRMLTIAALDSLNTPSGEKTDKQFTTVAPSSATHAKVFAIKGNLSPLAAAAVITLK